MISEIKIREIYDAAMKEEKVLDDLLENLDAIKERFKLTDSEIKSINTLLEKSITNKDLLKFIKQQSKRDFIPGRGPWWPIPFN